MTLRQTSLLTLPFFLAVGQFSSTAAGATIIASASVTCTSASGSVTNSTTSTPNGSVACGSFLDPSLGRPEARANYTVSSIYLEATGTNPAGPPGSSSASASVSLDVTGLYLLSGGVGAGLWYPTVSSPAQSQTSCTFTVDQVSYPCLSGGLGPIPIQFGVPFELRYTASGLAESVTANTPGGQVQFDLTNVVRQNGNLVSGVSLAEVPEPATLLLTGLGLAAVLSLRRRG